MPQLVLPAIAVLAFCLATALPAAAQGATTTAQVGAGRTVQVSAAPSGSEGLLLEFVLPDGRSQTFPQLGQALVPLNGKPGGTGLLARDLDGDGVDEVLLRGSVSPEMGAILVFQWNSAAGEFVPVQFTDDRDQTNPFAVVDATEPVILHPSGDIEVQFETTRQDGRKTTHVARYRWNGQHYTHTADN